MASTLSEVRPGPRAAAALRDAPEAQAANARGVEEAMGRRREDARAGGGLTGGVEREDWRCAMNHLGGGVG